MSKRPDVRLPSIDRRQARLREPSCPACGTSDVPAVARNEFRLYFRCPRCQYFWHIAKPIDPAPEK